MLKAQNMEVVSADPFEIRRVALLERLDRVKPKIVEILAPAGFGKSTLVRSCIRERGGAMCDCAGVRDEVDVASRLLRALGVADAPLLDGSRPLAERIEVAVSAWQSSPIETVTFENAQAFADSPNALEFLAKLLQSRPPHRSVIICTRRPLPLQLTRFAAPHDITVLRAPDLAFDLEEARRVLSPYVVDDAAIERVMAIARGWPIVLLMFRRLGSEGRFSVLLDRLDDIAFEELHTYFHEEVLGEFSAATQYALFLCAALPRATVGDLRMASVADATIEEIVEIANRNAVLSREPDGTFNAPLMLASVLLRDREEERVRLLRTLALAYLATSDFLGAAEVLLACGEQDAALAALENEKTKMGDRTQALALLRVMAKFDAVVLQRSPRFWMIEALMRRYVTRPEVMLDEAESFWRMLPPDAPLLHRAYIAGCRALFLSDAGHIDESVHVIEEFEKSTREEPAQDDVTDFVQYFGGVVRARAGHLRAGERDLQIALPKIEAVDGLAAGAFVSLGVDIARVRGERAVERQFIERAIERTRRSGLPNYSAAYYAEGLIGAWLAGETHLVEQYAAKLDEHVQRFDVSGLRFIANVAAHRPAEPSETDIPQYVMFGHLMEIAERPDVNERMTRAHAAFDAAQKTGRPYFCALAALALGFVSETERDESFAIARRAAEQCDAPVFVAAVEAVTSGEGNQRTLGPFVKRFETVRSSVTPPIEVRIASGAVAVDGRAVALSERELALVLALALRREPTPRTRLVAMLWPDLEESAARNALSVCVHRARGHLGRPDVIVSNGEGYALHAQARIDFQDIERVVAAARTRDTLGETHRGALLRVWREIRSERPSCVERWEWFEATERRLLDLRMEIAHRLASDALHRGDTRGALEFAEDVISLDPCDEAAREIAIRALLHEGDRAGAWRHFRQYRDALFAELQCEPSAAIAALVMS